MKKQPDAELVEHDEDLWAKAHRPLGAPAYAELLRRAEAAAAEAMPAGWVIPELK